MSDTSSQDGVGPPLDRKPGFLDLPAEIREIIYGYVFDDSTYTVALRSQSEIRVYHTAGLVAPTGENIIVGPSAWNEVFHLVMFSNGRESITQVCKLLRTESMLAWLRLTAFVMPRRLRDILKQHCPVFWKANLQRINELHGRSYNGFRAFLYDR